MRGGEVEMETVMEGEVGRVMEGEVETVRDEAEAEV